MVLIKIYKILQDLPPLPAPNRPSDLSLKEEDSNAYIIPECLNREFHFSYQKNINLCYFYALFYSKVSNIKRD